MKKKLILLFVLVCAVLLSLCGCSDFAFNPVGRWEARKEILYADGTVQYSGDLAEGQYGVLPALVFKKTGTGYIDSGTKTTLEFTYEYTDDKVTIERAQTGTDQTVSVEYEVKDNGSSLVAVIEEYDGEENGKTVHYRRDIVFNR